MGAGLSQSGDRIGTDLEYVATSPSMPTHRKALPSSDLTAAFDAASFQAQLVNPHVQSYQLTNDQADEVFLLDAPTKIYRGGGRMPELDDEEEEEDEDEEEVGEEEGEGDSWASSVSSKSPEFWMAAFTLDSDVRSHSLMQNAQRLFKELIDDVCKSLSRSHARDLKNNWMVMVEPKFWNIRVSTIDTIEDQDLGDKQYIPGGSQSQEIDYGLVRELIGTLEDHFTDTAAPTLSVAGYELQVDGTFAILFQEFEPELSLSNRSNVVHLRDIREKAEALTQAVPSDDTKEPHKIQAVIGRLIGLPPQLSMKEFGNAKDKIDKWRVSLQSNVTRRGRPVGLVGELLQPQLLAVASKVSKQELAFDLQAEIDLEPGAVQLDAGNAMYEAPGFGFGCCRRSPYP